MSTKLIGPSVLGLSREVAVLALRVQSQTTDGGTGRHTSDRNSLVRALKQMLLQIQGPTNTLIEMTHVSRIRLAVTRAFIQFDIAAMVPDPGSIPIAVIAGDVGVEVSLMDRLFRFAFCEGLFRETPPGSGLVSHTELSRVLLHLAAFIDFSLSPVNILPDLKLAEALQSTRFPKGAQTPIERAFRARFWDVLESDTELVGPDDLSEAMTSLSKASRAGAEDQVVLMFPWEVFRGETIVHLEGGQGQLAIELVKHVSGLRIIVQDLESNRRGAEKRTPPELTQSVIFRTHNILDAQPSDICGPVVYLLRWVLCNRQDDECCQILGHLLPRLRQAGSRLLIAEDVLPDAEPASTIPVLGESQIRATDIEKYIIYGSRLRSLHDFKQLLYQVDPGLEIQNFWGPEDSWVKILDIVLRTQ